MSFKETETKLKAQGVDLEYAIGSIEKQLAISDKSVESGIRTF